MATKFLSTKTMSDDRMRCLGRARPQASSVGALSRSSIHLLVTDGRSRIGHPWVPLPPNAIAGVGVGPRLLHVRRLEHPRRGVHAAAGWGPVPLGGRLYVGVLTFVPSTPKFGALASWLPALSIHWCVSVCDSATMLRITTSCSLPHFSPYTFIMEPAVAATAPSLPDSSLCLCCPRPCLVGDDRRGGGGLPLIFDPAWDPDGGLLRLGAGGSPPPNSLPQVGNPLRGGQVSFPWSVAARVPRVVATSAPLTLIPSSHILIAEASLGADGVMALASLSIVPTHCAAPGHGHAADRILPITLASTFILRRTASAHWVTAPLTQDSISRRDIALTLRAANALRLALPHEAVCFHDTRKHNFDGFASRFNCISPNTGARGHIYDMTKGHCAPITCFDDGLPFIAADVDTPHVSGFGLPFAPDYRCAPAAAVRHQGVLLALPPALLSLLLLRPLPLLMPNFLHGLSAGVFIQAAPVPKHVVIALAGNLIGIDLHIITLGAICAGHGSKVSCPSASRWGRCAVTLMSDDYSPGVLAHAGLHRSCRIAFLVLVNPNVPICVKGFFVAYAASLELCSCASVLLPPRMEPSRYPHQGLSAAGVRLSTRL